MEISANRPINQSTDRPIIDLLAPAKINLFLHVVGRRPDGYHELYSLMCCVSLYDRLVIQIGSPRNEIHCDQRQLPCDASNLALKAALLFNQALERETRHTCQPVSIRLIKQIPVGAGLGGGSSDAAAVLKGLNRYFGDPFDRFRLLSLGLQLGADVPFFIDARPAIAQGIGERLTDYKGLSAYWVVMVYPGFGISTARVYKNLNLALTKSKKKLRNVPFINGDFSPSHHLQNDLEAGVGDHFTVIAKLKEDLLNQGAVGSLMTGSGSVVFGLFDSEAQARKAQSALPLPSAGQVFVARLLV
jgi:4-diphosphocytidyl-2-C-methyl-D-erythritol kinase